MPGVDLAELYRGGQERVAGLVQELGPAEIAAPVPTCPGWTVRDVVAHLSGIAEDVVAGNTAGAMTDAWSAAQVARGRGRSVPDLLAGWAANLPGVEAFLTAHPRQWPAVIDIAAHEQDMRGAVSRPGARDNPIIQAMTPVLLASVRVTRPLVIQTEHGETRVGPDSGTATVLSTTRFEAFRLRMGRRSKAQVARLDWSADPEPYLDRLFVFGPSRTDIVE